MNTDPGIRARLERAEERIAELEAEKEAALDAADKFDGAGRMYGLVNAIHEMLDYIKLGLPEDGS